MTSQDRFDQFWDRFVAANPGLSNPDAKITLTVGAFRRQVEKAFSEGQKEDRKADASDLFRDLFGGR